MICYGLVANPDPLILWSDDECFGAEHFYGSDTILTYAHFRVNNLVEPSYLSLLETGVWYSGICLYVRCYRCELYILHLVLSLIINIFSVVK